MPRHPTTNQEPPARARKRPPARTPEARENQLIALAVDLAEQKLRDGTASSQIIAHFLKRGSAKEKKELELMEKQEELIDTKIQSIKNSKSSDELYKAALDMFKKYSGNSPEEDDEDEDVF